MSGIIQNDEVRQMDAEVFVKMREVGANLDKAELDEEEFRSAKQKYYDAKEEIENESWDEAIDLLKDARTPFNRMMKEIYGTSSLNKLYDY